MTATKPTYEELEQRILELEKEKLESKINQKLHISEADPGAILNAEELRSVMDTLPIGIAVNSVDPVVNFKYINENFFKYYRTTRDALADPDAFWTCVYEDPDFRKEIKKRILDDCASGDPERMIWADVPITRKGEKSSYISAQNIPIPNKQLMLSTVWDVTERKQTELSLKESESRFRELFENLYDGVAVYAAENDGNDFRFVDMNLSGQLLSKLKREDIIGKSVTRLFPGIKELGLFEVFQRVYRTGKTERVPMAQYKDDRISQWVDNTVFKLPSGEIVAVYRDESDRYIAEEKIRQLNRDLELRVCQRTAQLEEANKELEDFVYSVSHDLRAPLRSISGFAEIIDRRHKASLNEEGQHYFDNIVKASGQMDVLIDDLLRFSRLGRNAIKFENVSLADVFKIAIDTLADPIKKTEALVHLPEQMPVILGDSTLATHILINLLENAVKYHKPDVPPLIDISVEIEDKYVAVSIADNGIGIEKQYHEKIFNIFQRLHSQADYPGTGIGLAAVKKALQIMDGKVWVESEPGKGSIFKIKLLKAITT